MECSNIIKKGEGICGPAVLIRLSAIHFMLNLVYVWRKKVGMKKKVRYVVQVRGFMTIHSV